MTARIVGMMTLTSRSLACRTSRFTAVLPPTSTSVPTSSIRVRMVSTVASASTLSAGATSVAWTSTRPSTTFGG
jgi:hypothetical protein